MLTHVNDVLLTGATGFVGMEVLARYLERSDRDIWLLIRAADDAGAERRAAGVLENLFGAEAGRYADRVHALAADMTTPGLGLSSSRLDEVTGSISTIVHSAASVSFTLPLEEAREINVAGTSRMLDLAELTMANGGLDCYGHVSTAYVAGTFDGRFAEDDLDLGQGFHNSYEQSKHEAEQLVWQREGLPAMIMRPSIVVGDRRSGWTAAFNVLYWPLQAFARGLFKAVPAVPSAPVDVVSIDYVADAVHALCDGAGEAGRTYHLTAGEHASTIAEIGGIASAYFNRPLPEVVSPDEFDSRGAEEGAALRATLEGSAAYFPYFAIAAEFDDSRARACLSPVGIEVSPLADYLERLLDFATRSRWGKVPIARVEAQAA